jgi:hypothetical protein
MFRTLVPVANPFQHAAFWKRRCGFSTPARSGTVRLSREVSQARVHAIWKQHPEFTAKQAIESLRYLGPSFSIFCFAVNSGCRFHIALTRTRAAVQRSSCQTLLLRRTMLGSGPLTPSQQFRNRRSTQRDLVVSENAVASSRTRGEPYGRRGDYSGLHIRIILMPIRRLRVAGRGNKSAACGGNLRPNA